jgi:hypothetical protein
MGASKVNSNKTGGQRTNLNGAKGKKRTEQSTSHTGSRVEPSHEVEKKRSARSAKGAKPAAS